MSEADDFLALVARAQLRSAEGDWAEAAALWARVTAANPVNGDYWARLAEARFGNENYEAAQQAYEKVRELGVRSVFRQQYRDDLPQLLPGEISYRIACCQAALGRRDEAIDALAAALAAGFRELHRARDDEYWQPWHDDQRLRELLGIIDADALSRDQGWRSDLALLAREIKRLAYAPFGIISEEEFDRRVDRLDRDIPALTDAQVLVGMMKLVRHLDDGHAGVRPPAEHVELSRMLPVDFFLFAEGLFVIAAGRSRWPPNRVSSGCTATRPAGPSCQIRCQATRARCTCGTVICPTGSSTCPRRTWCTSSTTRSATIRPRRSRRSATGCSASSRTAARAGSSSTCGGTAAATRSCLRRCCIT